MTARPRSAFAVVVLLPLAAAVPSQAETGEPAEAAFDAFPADRLEDHHGGVATTGEFDDALREWTSSGFDLDDRLNHARLTATH